MQMFCSAYILCHKMEAIIFFLYHSEPQNAVNFENQNLNQAFLFNHSGHFFPTIHKSIYT